ncbi:hypothetical protein Daesc_001334 [Daldinia eschscholtzii]|uniref:F-box domain-containing protein n=1 Tax=Daldinia eschscholtzii TaxID=292717 RepID=A0AAX6MU92_9PEZI
MSLLTIPNELLLQVTRYLRDSQQVQALQAMARTCKALREIAEIYLYSTAEFSTLSALYLFLDAATRADSKRKSYLRSLKLLYSTTRYDYFYSPPYPPDLTLFPNLESFVSESPECQPRSVKGTHWGVFKDSYMRAFTQASLLNESVGTSRPLSKLRSRQEGSAKWEKEMPQRFQHQTALKSLIFTECVVSIEALDLILSFPRRLLDLTLCEKFYHRRVAGDSFAIEETDAFNRAISQQAESLESLHIERFSQYSNDGKSLVLSLSNFPALTHLQLGPFLQREFKYVLSTPVPPALKYLRLIEYGVSMLQKNRADKLLSDLSVDELLINCKNCGVPFTLDISLQHLPHLLRRPLFNGNDVRSDIRQLVNKLGDRFQELQSASTHPRLEDRSESSIRQTSSRLRILTNRRRNKIPPFLHDEGPPRFLVRYDSSHPERFLRNPYTANAAALDRDFSSDDEDMDIAFHNVDRSNQN